MDMALLIAQSGLDAHHKNIEVISNNLANSNTPSFKKEPCRVSGLALSGNQPGWLARFPGY